MFSKKNHHLFMTCSFSVQKFWFGFLKISFHSLMLADYFIRLLGTKQLFCDSSMKHHMFFAYYSYLLVDSVVSSWFNSIFLVVMNYISVPPVYQFTAFGCPIVLHNSHYQQTDKNQLIGCVTEGMFSI